MAYIRVKNSQYWIEYYPDHFFFSIGDSITAGTGALGRNIFELRNEYRGVSFSIGEVFLKKKSLFNNKSYMVFFLQL